MKLKIVYGPLGDLGLMTIIYKNLEKIKKIFNINFEIIPEFNLLYEGYPYLEIDNKKILYEYFDENMILSELMNKNKEEKEKDTRENNALIFLRNNNNFGDAIYLF
jgi:hypothetical protein